MKSQHPLSFALAVVLLLASITASEAQRKNPQFQNIEPNYNLKDRSDPRYAPHPSGGNVWNFNERYRARAASGEFWRVTSDCASACTIGFGHFPKDRMCIARNVRLGFHHGNTPAATAVMWNSYPAAVKALINARGGLKPEWLWIPASAFYAIGYKPC
ncbi:MAG: hypothetical protein KF835_13020 [Xanthobacteraceae bacterium]|nr:hypothetical protein [Xanthobacteraceae bacterium]